MLDACAEILAERGYDGLSTTLVAERAGVAIGSVYQFFPDKRALVRQLAQRNVAVFLGRVTARFEQSSFDGWSDAVNAVIEEYAGMHRTVPGFTAVEFGDDVGDHATGQQQQKVMTIGVSLAELLATTFHLEPKPDLPMMLANAVEVAEAMVRLAFQRDDAGDQATIDEAKWLMNAYLARALSRA
jgi:AcrR family transcriptional regulator